MAEILNNPILRGPVNYSRVGSSYVNAFAGFTTLGSGQTTVTVSTTAVKSDSLVWLQGRSTTVTSGYPLEIRTIIDSTSFVVSRADGGALPVNTTVYWSVEQV